MAESLTPQVSSAGQRKPAPDESGDETVRVLQGDLRESSAPKRWGDFQLLQLLGQGSFGEVYRAWDPVLEREIALKLLLPQGLNPDEEFASIVAEARALARVRHPNIVSVYGVDRRERRVGFWSDFVRGQTLTALITTQGPMNAQTVAQVGAALCDALAAVHAAGLLHRDIKASNAMRDENGRVLLMDFGLSHELWRSSGVAGTPAYMAPEVRAGHPASVQSDLYAMGILLRFLSTGDAQAREPSSGEAGIADRMAAALQEVIRKATCVDARERYASAVQMRDALSKVLEAGTADSASRLIPRKRRYVIQGSLAFAVVMGTILLVPRIEKYLRPGVPGTGSAAYQDYLAADDALVRYDKPGNTDKAIALYEKTLARSPDFALAEAGLARAYWRKYNDTADSKWADAATQASAKAMEMNPNLAAVQMTAGMIHVDQGKADLGMQELEQARQMDGHSASVYAALGEAYREAGRPGDEKAELQTAMDLAPDDWRWPYLLGALQIDSGDFAGAEQSLKTALGKTPDNARILYNLGLVYRKENRLTEAQAELEKSVALNAQTDSIMELGLVFLLEGNDRDSIGMYRRAVEMNSSDYSAWGNLAGAYQWSGQYPREGTDAYKKAVALGMQEMKRTPDDSFLVSSLGSFYANLQDEAHAMPFLRKAIVLAPGDPDVVERVGESYEALGHRQEALKLIGEALRLGFSIGYAKSEPALKALRQDPGAPEAIRDLHLSTPKTGGKS